MFSAIWPVCPSLPVDIEKILQSSCLFWPDKKVQETHLLVLIPKTINGKLLTLHRIGELVQAPKKGNKTQYQYFWDEAWQEHAVTPAPASHWVLMTRDVLPNNRDKTYDDQCKLLAYYYQKIGLSYQVPNALDAVLALLLEYVATGTRLYSNKPCTYTSCQEKIDNRQSAVGGFSASWLAVYTQSHYLRSLWTTTSAV